MEKILIAVDPVAINKNLVDFACFIAKLTKSELTAIFLYNQPATAFPVAKAVGSRVEELVTEPAVAEIRSRIKLCEDSVDFFEEACLNRGVRSSVHVAYASPVKEIVMESRFADLLIVDREMSIGNRNGGIPTNFVKEVLAKSECPVIITPFAFNGIEEILFVYDGTASSLFAIKQFAYLFPELGDSRITVAEIINTDSHDLPVAEKKMLGSFLQMHYSSIGFRVLQGNSGDELISYLVERKNIFVVAGSYNTEVELLLKTVNLPVFIANQ